MTDAARKRWTLIASILGLSIVIIDGTVVGVALPALADDLDASLAEQQWIANSYLLALASLMLVGGALGDIYGRRRIYLVGLVGFGVTSVACGLAPSAESLIAARAIQGAAGALLVPGTLAIISSTFAESERGSAIGAWAAWSGLAGALGPILGGGLVDSLSWRWVFLINAPVIAVAVGLVLWAVAESRDEGRDRRIDYLGAVLAAIGLGGVAFGLIAGSDRGWSDPAVIGALVGGFAVLGAFLVAESRSRSPLMPLEYFRESNFSAANAATLAMYAALGGAFFFIPIYLQGVAGYSALASGAALTPVTVIMLALSSRVGTLADRLGPRWFMAGGPWLAAAGLLLIVRIDADGDYLTTVLPGLVVFGVGLAITVAPLTTTVMDAVESAHAGVASGVNNMLSRVAGLVGIAVVGAVLTAAFRRSLDGEEVEAASTALAAARDRPLADPDTQGLSGEIARQVATVVEDASVSGFRWALLAAAGLAIIAGVVSAIWIRNPVRRGSPAACPPPTHFPSGPVRQAEDPAKVAPA